MDMQKMDKWINNLLNNDNKHAKMSVNDFLEVIPRIDKIDVPSGSPVLLRCDVDVKVNGKIGDDTRLKCALETINYCIKRGWITVLFGHVGRDPNLSLEKIATRFSELLGKKVGFIKDWFDEGGIKKEVFDKVSSAKNGDIIVLENTRKYDVERILWKPKELNKEKKEMAVKVAKDFSKISKVFINEAIASSNMDTSSCIIPSTMDTVALGFFFHEEMKNHLSYVREADLVVFSGTKMDKLDDLHGIVKRGRAKHVITAGALSMALKKAKARIDGQDFHIGLAQTKEGEKYFVSEERIEQAMDILNIGMEKGIDFVIPEDFKLDDGSHSDKIPEGRAQFDIGPKSMKAIKEGLDRFSNNGGKMIFHNGVFGRFENPDFDHGTKWFITELKRMKDSGVKVYVGGGEGAKALRKYGSEKWIDHAFSCGGTILTAMTDTPIPPLKAMAMSIKRT